MTLEMNYFQLCVLERLRVTVKNDNIYIAISSCTYTPKFYKIYKLKVFLKLSELKRGKRTHMGNPVLYLFFHYTQKISNLLIDILGQ